MEKIDNISYFYKKGGINLVVCKMLDKIFGGNRAEKYISSYYEQIQSFNYPKLLSDEYEFKMGRTLDLINPKTFNEKIQWMKLYDATLEKTKLADKYLVREWVKDKIGEKYLIPLLGVWNCFDDINFSNLPKKFVLKCNHGSGMNEIVFYKYNGSWNYEKDLELGALIHLKNNDDMR